MIEKEQGNGNDMPHSATGRVGDMAVLAGFTDGSTLLGVTTRTPHLEAESSARWRTFLVLLSGRSSLMWYHPQTLAPH